MADLLYWVWLSTRLTPGTDMYARLRTSFSSPEDIFHADEEELIRSIGSKATATIASLTDKDLTDARRILDYAAMRHVGILTYDDPRYPDRLRQIETPPVLLYYVGRLPDLENCFAVAVVGSRDYTEYGAKLTFEMAHDLAVGGATVVSGLAYGVDSIAASAAIAGGGQTLAVLGSGIDVIYPREHVKLARLVAKHGAVMTEYPPGTKPYGSHFPVRNRIISALSHVVLVTSASLRSGSLITARHAKQQGKQLYALPGNVNDPLCEGTALLLREGAHAAGCAEDILNANESAFPGIINLFRLLEGVQAPMEKVLSASGIAFRGHKRAAAPADKSLPDSAKCGGDNENAPAERVAEGKPVVTTDEKHIVADDTVLRTLDEITRAVYECIPAEGDITIDSVRLDGVSVGKISGCMTKLEIKQLIQLLPGGRVKRMPLPARKDS